MAISHLLARGRQLHRLLNSPSCPADIDDQREALFAERKTVADATGAVLGTEGFGVSLHDAFIEGFSERRGPRGYRSRFHADAIAYGPGEGGRLEEKGYCRLSFEVHTRQSMRALSGREVYTFLVDQAAGQLGASFHRPGQNMGQVVVDYDHLAVEKGPVRTWEELRRAQVASVPSVPATLRIQTSDGDTSEHPARWHTDGTILVLDGEQWTPYAKWAERLGQAPGSGRFRAWIDSGMEGVCSEIGADDNHGPAYASVKPLKNWLKRQAQSKARGPKP